MRRICEIRIIKKKPRLSDILRIMKSKDLSNPKVKEDFKNKILALYDDSVKPQAEQDIKYEKLMSNFDRMQKVIVAQQQALDHLEKKATILQKRREEREKNPGLRQRGGKPSQMLRLKKEKSVQQQNLLQQ